MLRFGKIFLALALAALISLSFSGCAPRGTTAVTLPIDGSEESTAADVNPANYARDIMGLVAYLEDSGLVTGDRVQMSYDVIGAKNGYKYNYRYNDSNVQLEVYEFDTANLPAAGETVQASLKATGEFDVLGNTVKGTLSSDGHFLLVYTDTKTDDVSTAHRERVLERFTAFGETA